MTSLLQSAAKIVFILIAITSCVAFIMGKLESKDFMLLASMAFAFYFAMPSNTSEIAGSAK
jgi:hypothetical protein